jgi:vancomycin resistance protein YoaR
VKGAPRRSVAIALVTTIVVLGTWLGSTAVASAGEVLAGITVGGVPVAGLQPKPLIARLRPAARALERRPITFYAGDREWLRTPESMGITIDLRRTASNALMTGRSNSFSWMIQSIGSQDRRLSWVVRIDKVRLGRSLQELKAAVKIDASNGDFSVEGSDVKVIPPKEGVELIPVSAQRAIVRAAIFPATGDRVALPVKKTPPAIRPEQLERVKEQAESILRAPVDFRFEGRIFRIAAEKIAPALKVNEVRHDGSENRSLVLRADPAVLKKQIAQAVPDVNRQPKDASFTVSGDTVTIHPSVDGATIDTAEAATALIGLAGGERRPIDLPVTNQAPSLTTDAASKLGITKRVSGFTTTFDARNAPRVGNIDRMAKAIDGKVLKPGEVFSLNGATGERTAANGYQEAGILVDGELVPGIGGGVCQVATTLFNAVYLAGLEVVERSNHSLYVSKYPTGRDAMVNFGFQDLRFRNDSQFGLLLKANVSAKALSVSIFSSDLGRTVTESASPQTNPRVPPVKYVDDPNLPAGTETVVEEGIPGFDVTVTRKVMQGDKVLHNDKFVSKYKPWKRIIKKGTGPAAAASPPVSPAPSAAPDPLAPADLPAPPN